VTQRIPTAFISYSWDSEEHKRWVITLATRLRENGVDVTLDRWHLKPGADKTLFMEKAVRESDHVLLICTRKYREKLSHIRYRDAEAAPLCIPSCHQFNNQRALLASAESI
jgi:hypothetical protein